LLRRLGGVRSEEGIGKGGYLFEIGVWGEKRLDIYVCYKRCMWSVDRQIFPIFPLRKPFVSAWTILLSIIHPHHLWARHLKSRLLLCFAPLDDSMFYPSRALQLHQPNTTTTPHSQHTYRSTEYIPTSYLDADESVPQRMKYFAPLPPCILQSQLLRLR
jgi:hypothetical protein